MKDFNDLVKIDAESIKDSVSRLSGDDKLNYLYFLRDEVNKQIKKAKR